MKKELIGHVGVDSGQLLLCDPCYIDSEWEKENFEDIRIYKHKDTNEILQYLKDFPHYEALIPKYGMTMNELLGTEDWEEFKPVDFESAHPFSYNACCQATLSSDGYGQLKYKMGHAGAGVAFGTGIGDGYFPVFAVYNSNNELIKVEVCFDN